MTERSLTPSAIAFGLSEVALEGCKKKKKHNAGARLQHTTLHISQCFYTKSEFFEDAGCFVSFFLPFVAAQFVRGDFSTHFAVKLGAEEGHAKAQLKRDPLVFSVKGWKKRIGTFSAAWGICIYTINWVWTQHDTFVTISYVFPIFTVSLDPQTTLQSKVIRRSKVDLLSVFTLLPSPLFSSVTSSKDSVLPFVSRPPPRWVSPWKKVSKIASRLFLVIWSQLNYILETIQLRTFH